MEIVLEEAVMLRAEFSVQSSRSFISPDDTDAHLSISLFFRVPADRSDECGTDALPPGAFLHLQ